MANNNYVVVSPEDDENGQVDAGSVRLFDGSTGSQLNQLVGDTADDQLGRFGVTALTNNNYVIASPFDDVTGVTNAGSVRLMNGTNGEPIGDAIAGDNINDRIGSGGITTLANNNYVIASPLDDEGVITNVGSVRLMDGTTGVQIGTTLVGDIAGDQLGETSITALDNNNYVVASRYDDEAGVTDAGSVRLMDGSTGTQIGSTLAGDAGDTPADFLYKSSITSLRNNHYVIASPYDDVTGVTNAGSVRLMDGTTGVQIGATLVGDKAEDQLGETSITALANNNYVVASFLDDENGIANAGSVRLMDGTTADQINLLSGDRGDDFLGFVGGGNPGVIALANNNFVIASKYDDENSITNAGSVRLMDGTNGDQIDNAIAGDEINDRIGSGGITTLANNNYVIASPLDDENSLVNVGSIRLVNGITGKQSGDSLLGNTAFDLEEAKVIESVSHKYYILSFKLADNNGRVNSGLVQLIAE